MNERHRAIRALLTTMAPPRAVAYIKAFELPEDEETVIIECDVRKKSCVQVGEILHVSPDTIKRYRRRAYIKIAADI